ncbi:hypothetical protein L228DRAFT_246194 [Xylona heveae TC161]|uniref:Required for respiratory growth protein 7, mitochondrial n=1 Tax=Xylona heveae (strain CBS 132557 / TC161) TaxID=1328760 RepID=A0A165HF89_XYLHT|nr:hypothetical protein L228DRAFT_246194 [Xylona heveae TC161]KZF23422.1 hypothetical protein L228DRAFT_246194 [Xylona heveae TC161]
MTFFLTSSRIYTQGVSRLLRQKPAYTSLAFSSTKATVSSNFLINGPLNPPSTSISVPSKRSSSTYKAITKDKKNHYDLASFLSYASRANLTPSSTTFVGTHYEYTVQETLRRLGFSLARIGGRSDFGIDLLGHWQIPVPLEDATSGAEPDAENVSLPLSLPVIVQCKAISRPPSPNMVRELEGAFAGAPAAYQAEGGVVGILATPKDATKGVRDALARSRFPLGFAKIAKETGVVEQLVWNATAVQAGLEGVGVTLRFCAPVKKADAFLGSEIIRGQGIGRESQGPLSKEVVLTWRGEELPDAEAQIHTLHTLEQG